MNNEPQNTQYEPLPSTFVEDSLQINLFLQNKPNFRKSQMNLSACIKMAYENICSWTFGENKPKQTQSCQACVVCEGVAGLIKPNFTYHQRGKTEVRCRMSEVRYLFSAFCFCRKASCGLAFVHGPNDRNRLRLQWHFRVQKTSQKQDFVFRFGDSFVCLCKWFFLGCQLGPVGFVPTTNGL